jgi:hypothetical protein
MRYQFTIANVTVSSDDQAAQENVFALLKPHFTKQEVADALLSASIEGVRTDQQLTTDMHSNDPERRLAAIKVLKFIHAQ